MPVLYALQDADLPLTPLRQQPRLAAHCPYAATYKPHPTHCHYPPHEQSIRHCCCTVPALETRRLVGYHMLRSGSDRKAQIDSTRRPGRGAKMPAERAYDVLEDS